MKLFKRSVALLAAAAVGVCFSGASAETYEPYVSADSVVTVSPLSTYSINNGEFEGWGTSLCWWANRVGYSNVLTDKAAELFFGDTGLRMNIARFNIGGGDDPSHDHITRTDSNMPGYTKYENGKIVYDWSADASQRNVLMKAIEAGGDDFIVEMFSNSPPYYMTKSGCSTGNTSAGSNNLKDDFYDDFADYMAEVCKHYRDVWGVDIQSVEPMNEPYTDYWGAYSKKQEGCHFDSGNSESKMITEMQRAMLQRGMGDVLISGTDETGIDVQINTYKALSDQAKNALSRIDTHTYGGSKRGELQALALSEGKNLWMSEVDGSGTLGSNAGEMGSALWLAKRMIDDCNGLGCSAWILWQAIDNHISSQGYNGKRDSGMPDITKGFWGLAVADHDRNDIILTKKYYAFGQFSRYIRPGAVMLNSSGNTLAAYDRENEQLVIVAVNTSGSSTGTTFDLSQFDSTGSSAQVIRTSGDVRTGENWAQLAPVSVSGKSMNVSLAPNSVTTFIIDNVKSSFNDLNEIKLDASMVTGSEPWKNSSDDCTKVVDGNNATFFDGVGNGWVQIDLGKVRRVDAVSFVPRAGYEYRAADGIFEVSADGVNWKRIKQIGSVPTFAVNYITDMGGNNMIRYVKYYVPDGKPENGVNKDSVYCCNIAEIRIYGPDGPVKGDLNEDGSVSAADMIIFIQHLTGRIYNDKIKYADMNEDGLINIADLILLKSEILK